MSTTIEWTDETWNPTTGCDRVSPGCDNCYALPMAKRLKAMEAGRIDLELLPLSRAKYQTDGDPRTSGPGFGIAMHPRELKAPFTWRSPRKVFVNSMSDLFHAGVSDEFLARVFATMALTPQHTYQILTKRPGRMRSLLSSDGFRPWVEAFVEEMLVDGEVRYTWPLSNVWLGVSVEDQKRANLHIPALIDTPAAMRFLSCEPLLGPVDLTAVYRQPAHMRLWALDSTRETRPIDWVIVGGESGHGARPMHPGWVRTLRDQCADAEVPFFFKQRGAWTWDRKGGDNTEPHLYLNASGETADEATALADGGAWLGMWKVGKHEAGRELDRCTHDEFPESAA